MARATILALVLILATVASPSAAETVVFPLVFEGGAPPLSIGPTQGLTVRPGDTLALEIRGLTVQDASVRSADGTVVDTAGWSFTVGGKALTPLFMAGQPPRYVVVVEQAFCGGSITSPQLPAGVPVECAQGAGDGGRTDGGGSAASTASRDLEDFDADLQCGYHRKDDRVTLCFDQDGIPYKPPPAGYIDDNDQIEVYLIVPEDEVRSYSVSVTGTINDQDVRLLGAGGLTGLKDIVGQLQALTEEPLQSVLAGQFGPFQAPSFTVTVNGPDGLQRPTSFTVNPTYTAALRFAVGESRIRFNDFAVRQFADGESRIQNVASEDGEVREFLNVVVFGWPFQDEFWNGRDLRKPPASVAERINPLLGIGLNDIGDEYLLGVSLELTRAFDAFVALHLAQVEELGGGFEEGSPFSGDASTLPTGETWEDEVIFGLSIDLRIATQVLGSLLGGGG